MFHVNIDENSKTLLLLSGLPHGCCSSGRIQSAKHRPKSTPRILQSQRRSTNVLFHLFPRKQENHCSISFCFFFSFSRALVNIVGTCPGHAQVYNEETWTCPLSFDFALSFNTRQNYIHSWFYYDNVKHGCHSCFRRITIENGFPEVSVVPFTVFAVIRNVFRCCSFLSI